MARTKPLAETAAPSRGTISRQLRGMIQAQDLSASELGRQAGVDPGVISRFLTGDRDIRLETLDRLADVLGLRLIEGARGKARPPARPAGRAKSAPRGVRAARADPVADAGRADQTMSARPPVEGDLTADAGGRDGSGSPG